MSFPHLVHVTLAQGLQSPKKITDFSKPNGQGFIEFGCAVAGWIFAAAIILSIVMVLLAAIGYMRSSGEPAKVKESTNKLIYAAIGVAVALISFFFPTIISGLITTEIGLVCS